LLDGGVGAAAATVAEDLVGTTTGVGEALDAVGGEDAEGAVFEATAEEVADEALGFFTFVGIDADADELAGGFDELVVAEQTVLRCCVARSEDAGDAVTLGGCGDKHDRAVAPLGFVPSGIPCGIPSDSGLTDGEVGGTEVGRAGAALSRYAGGGG